MINIVRNTESSADNTRKAIVKVGRDTVAAEYTILERTKLKHAKDERDKTLGDKLEYLWVCISMPFWMTRYWAFRMRRKIYRGFQRMFNGYDEVDAFSISGKFIERYSKILVKNRERYICPYDDMTEEEWTDIIDEMIYHLHYMNEENVIDELTKDVPKGWLVSSITTHEIVNNHKNEFFKLFSKYFYDLWY